MTAVTLFGLYVFQNVGKEAGSVYSEEENQESCIHDYIWQVVIGYRQPKEPDTENDSVVKQCLKQKLPFTLDNSVLGKPNHILYVETVCVHVYIRVMVYFSVFTISHCLNRR